jgi:hypothetical protein
MNCPAASVYGLAGIPTQLSKILDSGDGLFLAAQRTTTGTSRFGVLPRKWGFWKLTSSDRNLS